MNEDSALMCPWTERVSALIDGELPSDQVEMARVHLRTCESCTALARTDGDHLPKPVAAIADRLALRLQGFPARVRTHHRILLAVVGVLLLIGSIPDFGRGNSRGVAFHDLRHLAIWQVAVGVAVVSAAITFRISRLITVMMVTFLALTLFATAYDLVTGHRGPWADPLHVVEVVAVVAILRIVAPIRRLSIRTST
jgi:hypothetical protein